MNIRTDILLRVYVAFGLIVLFAFAVLFKLFHVQLAEGARWRKMAQSASTKLVKVAAARGNIYSVDGSLLASSVPEYDIRMDLLAGGIEQNDVFDEKVDSLASSLANYFGDRSAAEYSKLLRNARRDRQRYLLIRRNVSHHTLQEVRKFPIFKLGKISGGLIAVQKNKRIRPFKNLAARTIGYKNEHVQPVGLEGAYSKYIDGESGSRLMQRIAGGIWIPVNRDEEIAPKEGADIISTLDINIQDVAQRALLKQLMTSDADHGCVVLMEVATGEIRAIANYTKGRDGNYTEQFNYAINESLDPGSTFKLASYMALLEDKRVDTNTVVHTPNEGFTVYGKTIKESHGPLGSITVKKAFEVSSNVAISMLVQNNYKSNPAQFTDHLYKFGLNKKLGLQIPGESTPVVKNPNNRSWSGLTLAQMSYGYEMRLTPLQMLTFYNSVANNGKMVAPVFVREIRRLGVTVERFDARVINEKVCSDETLGKVRKMLEGVVEEGTGKDVIKNQYYKVAGKTGTAQVADGSGGYKAKRTYQASFCGYFPAEKPKYSMIVVLNNPKGAYYAALVAGPVFREVADKVYASDAQMFNNVQQIKIAGQHKPQAKAGDKKLADQVVKALKVQVSANDSNRVPFAYTEGAVPNVTGMGLKDAMFLLGNSGMRAIPKGSGKVIRQSVLPGTKVAKGYPVVLELN
ncbi:MAG: penicillin-binding protein [Sphingobacteriaceae bacterium]